MCSSIMRYTVSVKFSFHHTTGQLAELLRILTGDTSRDPIQSSDLVSLPIKSKALNNGKHFSLATSFISETLFPL